MAMRSDNEPNIFNQAKLLNINSVKSEPKLIKPVEFIKQAV